MSKLIEGIYSFCDSLQPVGLAVGILMCIWYGINFISEGADGKAKMRENFKAIVIGLAICFLAPTIGKEIASWFM